MHFSIPKSSYLTWMFSFISLFSLAVSDPRISEAGLFCGNTSAAPPRNASYIPNFVKGMEVLSQLVAADHWGHFAVNSTPPIFGLAQCHQDLSHTDCLLCFAVGRTRLPHCLPSISARIYLDGCFIRYESFNFFNESVDPVGDTVSCGSSGDETAGYVATELGFERRVGELIGNVTESAASKGGFAAEEVEGVFGLAQCWKTLGGDGCRDCLEKAANEMVRLCLPRREGRGLNAGCYLRYSTVKFFNDGPENIQQSSGTSAIGDIVTIALAASAFSMFSFFAGYACYVRLSRLRQGHNNLGQVATLFNNTSLNLKYETLEKATNYFDDSRKLGQGGAGSVFKGTLPNRETIAVKRLFFNTRPWVDEFFNEVNLISGIQHKNLVKLLGCSIEGPESLLVYEKNTAFIEDSSCSFLHTVWKLYKRNRVADSVDLSLNGDFPAEEASRVLQIGLLCTQASAALRPSMAEVVHMLTYRRDCEIPVPNQPPFLNGGALNAANSDRSFGLDSLISNALMKIKAPYASSTESSSMIRSDESYREVRN
ncbi:hypothetical protein U1Q18_012474 [Sarracenia purpurea var. burkii]